LLPAGSDLTAEKLAARIGDCSHKCAAAGPAAVEEARERARVERDGPELVLAYKRCMVVADSTPLARKYQAYDDDLYADLLGKANAVCRRTSRCDWLEKYGNGTLACSYTP
jgi:hypothetical protein